MRAEGKTITRGQFSDLLILESVTFSFKYEYAETFSFVLKNKLTLLEFLNCQLFQKYPPGLLCWLDTNKNTPDAADGESAASDTDASCPLLLSPASMTSFGNVDSGACSDSCARVQHEGSASASRNHHLSQSSHAWRFLFCCARLQSSLLFLHFQSY